MTTQISVSNALRSKDRLSGSQTTLHGVFLWRGDGLCVLTDSKIEHPPADSRIDIVEPRLMLALERQVMCQLIGGPYLYWTEATMTGTLSVEGARVVLQDISTGVIHCAVDGTDYPFVIPL